ncbi:MAG: hypothetical protein AABY22_34905 [Nanoarchaeota archaeon]
MKLKLKQEIKEGNTELEVCTKSFFKFFILSVLILFLFELIVYGVYNFVMWMIA